MKKKAQNLTRPYTSREERPDETTKRSKASEVATLMISALVLILAVIGIYSNSLSGPFIFDDLPGIIRNEHIKTLWPLSDTLFNAPPDSPPAGRPFVSLSLAINYAIGGLDVYGYHLFNIACHMASTFVLWGILRQVFLHTRLNERFGKSAKFLAFAITLIWAVHPLHTETVNYVVQRTELMMGLFYFLTLYCAIRSWRSTFRRFWTIVAIVLCAIGMGCKETMVSAPLMVLLVDGVLISSSLRDALRKHAGLYIGLAATWALLVCLHLIAPREQSCGWDIGISLLDYLRTQAEVIVWYLRLSFWPHPLVICYQDWPLAKSFSAILPEGLFIIALLALTAWALWRRHPAALLGAWFFMILAPTSSFIPIVTEIAAERRMYLPLAAVIVAAVIVINELMRLTNRRLAVPSRGRSAIAMIALALVATLLGATTLMRNRDYRSAISIWTDAVTKRPNNADSWCNLAADLGDAGEHKQAIHALTRAIELKPNRPMLYYNRGTSYATIGEYAAAIQDFNQVIEMDPDFAGAYHNRGSVYGLSGDYSKAIADYTRDIALRPNNTETYYNRGTIYNKLRDYAAAIEDFNRAIELKPDDAGAYYNRAVSYYWLKDYTQARSDIEKCQQHGGQVSPEFIKVLTSSASRPG